MLDGIHNIHLIGIAGSGMRAIANILISQGFAVSGSDIKESAVTERFRKMGAVIHIGHNGAYVKGADAVVRSTAIHDDNPELVAAREAGIPILHRSDIVKAVLDVTKGIAVAGALFDMHVGIDVVIDQVGVIIEMLDQFRTHLGLGTTAG